MTIKHQEVVLDILKIKLKTGCWECSYDNVDSNRIICCNWYQGYSKRRRKSLNHIIGCLVFLLQSIWPNLLKIIKDNFKRNQSGLLAFDKVELFLSLHMLYQTLKKVCSVHFLSHRYMTVSCCERSDYWIKYLHNY